MAERSGAVVARVVGGRTQAEIYRFTLVTLLWRDADPELRPLATRATRRLAVIASGFVPPTGRDG